MATPEAQEAAAKDRIIKHMNADHQASIQRYLEVATEKTWFGYGNAQMTDITNTEMKIRSSGKETLIPFSPPMKSLREARERLVQMDKDALQTLGRSSISITEFIPSYTHPAHLFNFIVCLSTYVAFCRSANFQPGSLLFDNLLYMVPRFANFCFSIQPYLFWIMISIHLFECGLMVKKLRKHGLTPFERLWWLWVGTCFVEGFTSFNRLNRHIAKKRKENEAKKH